MTVWRLATNVDYRTLSELFGLGKSTLGEIVIASDYYNRKGYYSVIMQAVVDFRGLFMDVYIG